MRGRSFVQVSIALNSEAKAYGATIASEQVEALGITATVTAFGSDTDGDCGSSGGSVKSSLDACLAVPTTVTSVVVRHPPPPPPASPPAPGLPPSLPPDAPQSPPDDRWYEKCIPI